MLYFPIGIYMGKIAGARIALGCSCNWSGWCWPMALARFAWRRGIKKYAAFGG